jgi:hypothetical protein
LSFGRLSGRFTSAEKTAADAEPPRKHQEDHQMRHRHIGAALAAAVLSAGAAQAQQKVVIGIPTSPPNVIHRSSQGSRAL